MLTKVIIEPWRAHAESVHVHEEGNMDIHSLEADVVSDVTVKDVMAVGKISGMLTVKLANDCYLKGNCRDFCQMCDYVLTLSDTQVATARGQIEDCLDGPLDYTDMEVGYLDWLMRERKKEQAWECDNPFDGTLIITDRNVADVLNNFHNSRN